MGNIPPLSDYQLVKYSKGANMCVSTGVITKVFYVNYFIKIPNISDRIGEYLWNGYVQGNRGTDNAGS
jgi:uncharacterized surface anchored protein